MKRTYFQPWIRSVLLALISLSFQNNGMAQNVQSGMMPVDLKLLFSVLPDEVEGWKLTKSKGRQGHYIWMEAIVTREFEPVNEDENAKAVQSKVRISIKDTCKFQKGNIQIFSNFTPKKVDTVEYLYIKSIPVIISERDTKLVAQFFLEGRFIANLTLYDLPRSELGEWFQRLKIDQLAAVKDGPIVSLGDSAIEISIDQLKSKSRTTVIGISSDEEHEPSTEE